MAHFEISNLLVKHSSFEGERIVLDIERLHIEKGEIYGLVGESGEGKTVMAMAVLKLLQCPPGIVERGSVTLGGVDLMKLSQRQMERQVRGSRIAMIFQDPMSCLNPVFTVKACMVDALRQNRKLGKKEAEAEAARVLEEVKLPDPGSVLRKYPHQLSGGQRQRVIIALALCCGADFLIADEPTRNLDVTIQASILKLLVELQQKRGLTVLYIANNLGLISAFCNRVGILRQGRIIEEGPTSQVISSPKSEYAKLLLDACAIAAKAEPANGNEALLRVENLKKYFDINDDLRKIKHQSLRAVDGVSFELMRGETLGIVGESGCGKSTLVNTILGLHAPTEGKVFFEGKSVYGDGAKKGAKAFKKAVQIVFQDPFWSLNPRWLVKDIVAEPLDVYEKLGDKKRLERVCELLAMVGLEKEACFKYPHEFSGGQRQRIAIARSLASSPKLVVLDEPTSSIDVLSQNQVLDLIKGLKRRFGLTNILISHDLSVVHELSNAIAVMYLGKIVEMGPAEEIFKHPRHPYTQALFDAIPRVGAVGMDAMRALEGQIPSPITPPSGCAFHTRCPYARERCKQEVPAETYVGEKHFARCIKLEEPNENSNKG
jgi:oligopeptide/dipeptide ABC transporter ATP-binding protein